MALVVIDMPSSQQQHSSDSMQNNNDNNRSLVSTGVGAQEKFVPITTLLEMGASRLGVLVCGWVVLMLVQDGIVVTVETKDRVSVTVLFFLICFRCWRYFYPQNTGSLSEATQSLSADNIQQLAIPIGFISRLFYWWNLVSVMSCVVLSMMRLASQDFGQTEVANKGARDFALNVFYGLAFAEALMFLFALTLVTIMAMQRKVTEALTEWMNPSQLVQALPTHQNTTLLERAECQVHPNFVGYSHLPAPKPHDSVKPSKLAQEPPTHQNTTLLEKEECQIHPNSVGYSHLPASEPHDFVKPSQLAQEPPTHQNTTLLEKAECQIHPNSVGYSHLPASKPHDSVNDLRHLRYLGYSHLPASEPHPDFVVNDLTHLIDLGLYSTVTAKVSKEFKKLIHALPFGCVPRSGHDLFRTINWGNLKYIHPSLERGLRRRVSRPRQLLLKEDCSDDSEGNLPPHLKAD